MTYFLEKNTQQFLLWEPFADEIIELIVLNFKFEIWIKWSGSQ